MTHLRILLVLGAALLAVAAYDSPSAPPLAEGTYYAYEYDGFLSGHDPDGAEWYHAHVMTIRGGEVADRTYPLVVQKSGEVFVSASDGGFRSYHGAIETDGARTIFRLRLTGCDYCGVTAGMFERVDEYVARIAADGSFEVNHVDFQPRRNPRFDVLRD